MKIGPFIFFLGLFSCQGSLFRDSLSTQGVLTILSWNVQNLFDEADQGGEYPDFQELAQNWNYRMLYNKMEAMTQVLRDLPALPHVMFWQEVENLSLAHRFVRRFLKSRVYHTIVGSENSSPQVVLFSQVPLELIETLSIGLSGSTQRDFIKVWLTWEGESITLVGVHLKSWAGGDPSRTQFIRQQELTSLGEWLEVDQKAGRTIVILGDLNTRTRQDLWDEQDLVTTGRLGDSNLVVQDLTAGRTDGTYFRKGNFHWLDGALLILQGSTEKEVTLEVFNHPRLQGKQGEPVRWSKFNRQGISDHFPFLIHLKVNQEEYIDF